MQTASVWCIGEALWDIYPEGPRLGGAPLNVAVHLARQGVQTRLVASVGRDDLGTRALAFLEREGISGTLCHPTLPTGTVRVALGQDGLPTFTIAPGAAWTDLAWGREVFPPPAWGTPDVLVFGGLAMHSPANRDLLSAWLSRGQGTPALRICDLNLRPGAADGEVVQWCVAQADVLKVNEEESQFLAGTGLTPACLHRFGLKGLCVTLGSKGIQWTDAQGPTQHLPACPFPPDTPIDTVGAGDAVTAALALGLATGEPIQVTLERAMRWAAQVCRIPGALPPPQA